LRDARSSARVELADFAELPTRAPVRGAGPVTRTGELPRAFAAERFPNTRMVFANASTERAGADSRRCDLMRGTR